MRPNRKVLILLTRPITKLLSALTLLLLLLTAAFADTADPTSEAAKMLPDAIGDFRAQGEPIPPKEKMLGDMASAEDFNALSSARRIYSSARGESFTILLVKTRSDSSAYALLTRVAAEMRAREQAPTSKVRDIGIASFASSERVIFFKGPAFVSVTSNLARQNGDGLAAFARAFAETLNSGENEIPVLLKHLPDWETVQERAAYAVSLKALQDAAGNRPALDAVSFEGGVEAVTALYGPSRLIILENTTPQLATTNDARINARLKELREKGQPVPSAYRRVGNYCVFVFDAPSEQEAARLMDNIKYEQVVQWLGDNPYALQRAQKEYTQTTAGVILAVIQASGLSLLVCLGIGAIFGTLVFRRRRSQQAATEAYTDAGGMVRLNIDDMTAQTDPTRLLGRGDR
jgi:hypothetical protein